MGRHYGALCKACGSAFEVAEGDIRLAELVRCDGCGKGQYVARESRRRSEHLARLLPPAHAKARRAASAGIADEQHRIRSWTAGWRAELPFAAGVVRRARARLAAHEERQVQLERTEAALLAAQPLPPPAPPCACGGNYVRGARIRCPACGSTTYTRDPSVPELMVD